MAKDNAVRFEEEVMKSEELQKRLMDAARSFDGDRTDEKAIFEAVIFPIAKEIGMEFSYEEASGAKNPDEDRELNPDELQAVAGGYGAHYMALKRLIKKYSG